MNYSDWILSIYYEYQKKYDEGKDKKEKTSKKFKDLDTKTKIKLVVYISAVILGGIIYIYGIVSSNPIDYILGVLLFIVPSAIMIYIDQLPLKYYKRSIIILNNILKKDGLDNVKSIEQLITETGGNSKIKKVRESITVKSTGSFITNSGIAYILSGIDNEIIKNVFIIVMVLFWGVGTVYCILRTIPRGKMVRRREFNQLLKILLFYKQNSTKDIEDIEEVEERKEVSIKEINLK